MRGDSRIDLFAKSAALIGLGLIAAIGAAVDYWPGDVRLPARASIPSRLVTPAVRTAINVQGLDEASPRALVVRTSHQTSAVRPTLVTTSTEAPVAPRPEVAVTLSETEVLPALDPRAGFTAHALPSSTLSDAETSAETSDVVLLTERWQPLPPMLPVDQSDNGFFSGMLKKTGSSLGSSLSSVGSSLDKARTSLTGAVRIVSDVVKKAF